MAMMRLARRLCSTSSFVQRARESRSCEALLGAFKSNGSFDKCLEAAEMQVTSIGVEGVTCELTVTAEVCNNFKTLHGGATSTLVDVVGTLALLGRDPTRPGVSVEMNQSFCAAAKEGQKLQAVGKVVKYGKTLGFTEVTVASASDPAKVIATGRHTKFLAV